MEETESGEKPGLALPSHPQNRARGQLEAGVTRSAAVSAAPLERNQGHLQQARSLNPLPVGQYLPQRIFSVVKANRAKTNAAIQKRAMILDSFQPISSKWWCSGAILKMRLPRN